MTTKQDIEQAGADYLITPEPPAAPSTTEAAACSLDRVWTPPLTGATGTFLAFGTTTGAFGGGGGGGAFGMLIETSLTELLAEKVEVDEDDEAEELLDRSTVAVTSDAGTWKK